MNLKESIGRRTRVATAVGTLLLTSQLAGCGGGGGSSVSNPPPSQVPPPVVVPPQVATVSLKFAGKVTDEPIANAEVTVTVGDETFTTTADANGDYSVDVEIEEADVGAFVVLSARGVGAQSFVQFTSLAGSFQSLLQQAGDDESLSSDENFATQITNVSTAAAVLLREANGGEPVTSEAVLLSLSAAINAQDVLDLATAIKLAVDDAENYPLPEGQTSILALVSNAAARQDFINDVYAQDPDAFAATQVAIAQDPNLAQPLEAGVIEAYLANEGFTTALLSSNAEFSFNYGGRVSHFDLFEGGVGSESTDTYEQAYTWTVEGSAIKVTYTEPVETFSWDSASCGGVSNQYLGRYVTVGATISFLNARTVAITTTSDITYASCPELDKEETSTVARTVLSMDNFDVIDMEEKYGQAQTIYVWDSTKGAVVADVAEINADGTGRALLTNQDFTWELNADGGPEEQGKIVQLNFSNGSQGEYLSFRDIDELASDIFWEIRVEGGPVLMGAGASIFADPAYAVTGFTTEDVVGRYYQFGTGEEVSGDPRLKGFRLRFDADGTGAEEIDSIENGAVVTEDETTNASKALRWSIEEGSVGIEVVVRRTFDLANGQYNCVFDGVNPDCVLFDERRIIPIVVNDSGRYYWVEVRRVSETVINPSTPTTHLVRFYDHEAFSEAAVSASLKGQFAPKVSKPSELLRGPQLR